MPLKIGGFFPLLEDIPEISPISRVTCGESLWTHWNATGDVFPFSTARGALAWLIRVTQAKNVWLPAYTCHTVGMAVEAACANKRFYPLNAELCPAQGFAKDMISGDLVILQDFMGRPVPDAAYAELQSLEGVCVVEDRAHALDIYESAAAWTLLSPRKLVGVPDGGILIYRRGRFLGSRPEFTRLSCSDIMQMSAHRLYLCEDPERTSNTYSMYKRHENSLIPKCARMSAISEMLFRRIPLQRIVRKRRENYGVLASLLAEYALFPVPSGQKEPDWTPLGFPVLVRDAAAISTELAAKGVFATRYWEELAWPGEALYEAMRQIHYSLLVLPCDQRYAANDMAHLAQCFTKCVEIV